MIIRSNTTASDTNSLWRGSLLPLGFAATARFLGRFAAQREKAPSPQKRSRHRIVGHKKGASPPVDDAPFLHGEALAPRHHHPLDQHRAGADVAAQFQIVA